MSYDPTPEPEPTTTMGSGMKTFLGIAGVFVVCCLLCCGGFVATTWWATAKVKELAEKAIVAVEEPAEIEQRADRIVQMDAPAGLNPKAYWEISNPLDGELVMGFAIFEDPDNSTAMVLGDFGSLYDGALDPEQLRQEVEQSLREQGENVSQEINTQETSTLPATINGQETSFVVLRGTFEDKNAQASDPPVEPQERVVLQGTFQSERGTGFLLLQGPGDQFTDEELQKLVESME